MNERIMRRLTYEMKDNYEVTEYDEGRPVRVIYTYERVRIPIYLGKNYPFHSPRLVGNWAHAKYEALAPYIRQYACKNRCVHCMDWSPGHTVNTIIERFIKIDTTISNCVKLDLVFRNTPCLPEAIFPVIFSYLEE